jgi:DNA-binding Xre family transcriptional regulator
MFSGGLFMISYAPFYETLKKKGFSTYKLVNQYGISRSLLDRLKHDKPISTVTVNDLCEILDCSVSDVLIYVKKDD